MFSARSFRWNNVWPFKSALAKNDQEDNAETNGMLTIRQCFEPRFTIIYDREILSDHIDMIEWIDKHTTYPVQAKVLSSINIGNGWFVRKHSAESPALNRLLQDRVFIGFENDADALIFKIKYM